MNTIKYQIDDPAIAQVLIDISAHHASSELRSAAQMALEPLPIRADELIHLMQPPLLGPATPTPALKRAKLNGGAEDIQRRNTVKEAGRSSHLSVSLVLNVLLCEPGSSIQLRSSLRLMQC